MLFIFDFHMKTVVYQFLNINTVYWKFGVKLSNYVRKIKSLKTENLIKFFD